MCVKEFLGYNCGHCSIPYLRQCPLTESNETFPPCKFPAERPIHTNDNCHACSRILWNKKVLEEEERHRELHMSGLCECEVIFDPEERGRRMRPRAAKGKGKMRELDLREYTHGHDHEMSSAGEGSGVGYIGRQGPGVGYQNREAMSGAMGGGGGGGESSRQHQDPLWEAKLAAYEYVGYFVGGSNPVGGAIAHVEKGFGFPEGGYVSENQLWEGQMRLGQPGAGMRWYPEQSVVADLPELPALPPLPPIPAPEQITHRSPRAWQRASSEPADTSSQNRTGSPAVLTGVGEVPATGISKEAGLTRASNPVVVSSEMAKTVPK